MNDVTGSQFTESEVAFADVLATVRKSIKLISTLMIFGAVIGGVSAWLVPREYEASTVVLPESSDSANGLSGGLSSLASQFSGLAALAGVTPQTDSKKAEALAVLQSDQLTQLYISQNDLLPVLYRKQWDPGHNAWKKTWFGGTPTLWKAGRLFKKSIRRIETDTKTGLVTLTITWKDPVIAAKWANGLINLENVYLRDKAIRESESNIAYLNKQAAATDVLGIKQVIYSILENEIDKAMIARGSEEYSLKVEDPAFAPERAAYPIPALWVTIGTLLGLFIGVFIAFLRKEQQA